MLKPLCFFYDFLCCLLPLHPPTRKTASFAPSYLSCDLTANQRTSKLGAWGKKPPVVKWSKKRFKGERGIIYQMLISVEIIFSFSFKLVL